MSNVKFIKYYFDQLILLYTMLDYAIKIECGNGVINNHCLKYYMYKVFLC